MALTLGERLQCAMVFEPCLKSLQSFWATKVRWQRVTCHQEHKRAPLSCYVTLSSEAFLFQYGCQNFTSCSGVLKEWRCVPPCPLSYGWRFTRSLFVWEWSTLSQFPRGDCSPLVPVLQHGGLCLWGLQVDFKVVNAMIQHLVSFSGNRVTYVTQRQGFFKILVMVPFTWCECEQFTWAMKVSSASLLCSHSLKSSLWWGNLSQPKKIDSSKQLVWR